MKIFMIMMMSLFLWTAKGVTSEQNDSLTNVKPKPGFDFKHMLFTEILQEVVVEQKNGSVTQVKYEELKAKPEKLNQYLTQLSSVSRQNFDQWNKPDQLAFLINAYNAFTLKLIINYLFPEAHKGKSQRLQSIKDICDYADCGWIAGSPWKLEWIDIFGGKHSLDTIEHKWIRGWFQEPRIHFAVNCASIGCPALRSKAYVGSQIDHQLEDATKKFLTDSERNHYDARKNTLYLSKIFFWYKRDFTKQAGTLAKYVQKYLSNKENASTKRLAYDWNLNIASGKP